MSASEQSDTPTPPRLTAEGFAARYQEHWRILWCAAVSIVRDKAQAQDVVQQAAVVGLENLGDFDAESNFVSWMVKIVKNIALNESRKVARRRTSATEFTALDARVGREGVSGKPVLSGRGAVLPDQQAFDDAVVDALEQLDETARACLLMRVVLDLPYAQIARSLDIPEGTAASHVHRARRVVRERLVGGSSGAAAGSGGLA